VSTAVIIPVPPLFIPVPAVLQVAAVFGMPVQQLLQDNLHAIRTPEQQLGGITLTLCGVQLVKPRPKPRPPVVASQVEALLAIRSMIDKNGVLASSWSLQNANRYSGMVGETWKVQPPMKSEATTMPCASYGCAAVVTNAAQQRLFRHGFCIHTITCVEQRLGKTVTRTTHCFARCGAVVLA
jgi:hypothetical protein